MHEEVSLEYGKHPRSACAHRALHSKGLSGYEPNGEASTTKGTHWQSFDAGMAADHFCLAARAVDLGTLIMGRYDEEKIKEILDLPEEYDVSCIIAVGHPEVIPAANERKPLKEVLTFR